MLAGQATLRLGGRRFALKAGDYVCFPAGAEAAALPDQ
ncbi:MAG: cupin domain-containing protein [Geminicoccaceae bacterium]